jgi:hypothetical protein
MEAHPDLAGAGDPPFRLKRERALPRLGSRVRDGCLAAIRRSGVPGFDPPTTVA